MQKFRDKLIPLLFVALLAPSAPAAVSPDIAQKLYADVTPSLVVVQYVWQSELGRANCRRRGSSSAMKG